MARVVILTALASLICLTIFLKNWKPKRIFRFDNQHHAEVGEDSHHSFGQIMKAWSPFVILTIMVTIWSLKPFKALFAAGGPPVGDAALRVVTVEVEP